MLCSFLAVIMLVVFPIAIITMVFVIKGNRERNTIKGDDFEKTYGSIIER